MGELICYNIAVGLEPIDETRETRCARISGAFVFGMLQRAWFPNLFFYLLDSPWKNWKIYNKEGIENFTPLSTSSRRIFSSILSFFVFNCHRHKGRRHLAGSHRFLRFYCYLPTKKLTYFSYCLCSLTQIVFNRCADCAIVNTKQNKTNHISFQRLVLRYFSVWISHRSRCNLSIRHSSLAEKKGAKQIS